MVGWACRWFGLMVVGLAEGCAGDSASAGGVAFGENGAAGSPVAGLVPGSMAAFLNDARGAAQRRGLMASAIVIDLARRDRWGDAPWFPPGYSADDMITAALAAGDARVAQFRDWDAGLNDHRGGELFALLANRYRAGDRTAPYFVAHMAARGVTYRWHANLEGARDFNEAGLALRSLAWGEALQRVGVFAGADAVRELARGFRRLSLLGAVTGARAELWAWLRPFAVGTARLPDGGWVSSVLIADAVEGDLNHATDALVALAKLGVLPDNTNAAVQTWINRIAAGE